MRITPLPTALTVALAGFLFSLTPPPAIATLAGMQQKGKPKPPSPPPSTYSATLGSSIHDDPASTGNEADYPDASQDGLKPAGYVSLPSAQLTGLVTGPNGNGNFTGTIAGSISDFVITGVDELPDWFDGGNPCQENEVANLRSLGLVGSGLSGNLSWTLTELTGALRRSPRITWQLDGVMDSQGAIWSLAGHSGSTRREFFPVFEPGSTADNLTVTVEGSVIDFVGPTMSVLKCRADYTMTLAKVSSSAFDR